MHNLIFNKLIALVLIGAGAFAVWMEGDGTFLIFALLIGVPMFFAKENWTTIEVRSVFATETEYAVEVNNKNGFVRQLDIFQTYEQAECFREKCDEPLDDDEYLNIIFIDYDEFGNEIGMGTVL